MGSALAWGGSVRDSGATLDSCLNMDCCGWNLLVMGSKVGVAVVAACRSWVSVDSWAVAQRRREKRKRHVGDAYFQMRADGNAGDKPTPSSLSGRRYACMASCAYVSQLGKSPKPAYQRIFPIAIYGEIADLFGRPRSSAACGGGFSVSWRDFTLALGQINYCRSVCHGRVLIVRHCRRIG